MCWTKSRLDQILSVHHYRQLLALPQSSQMQALLVFWFSVQLSIATMFPILMCNNSYIHSNLSQNFRCTKNMNEMHQQSWTNKVNKMFTSSYLRLSIAQAANWRAIVSFVAKYKPHDWALFSFQNKELIEKLYKN